MTIKLFNISNIILILFFWLIGLIMGGYYFFNVGVEFYNKWLVLSAWNEGYKNGYIDGSTHTTYLLFEDYIKSNPYKLPAEDIR